MTNKVISAATMVELRQKLRKAMGWEDRRTWRDGEWEQVEAIYQIAMDWQTKKFTATKK